MAAKFKVSMFLKSIHLQEFQNISLYLIPSSVAIAKYLKLCNL